MTRKGRLRDAAASAYIYGLPLIEMARARAMHFDKGNRPNRLGHDRTLNTPATQDVTTPNTTSFSRIETRDKGLVIFN